MNENEIWRPIEGYEGLYEVSNLGRVKSLKYREQIGVEKVLKPLKSGPPKYQNYLAVNLCKKGKVKLFRIHRLVAKAFPEICGEWFDGCQVNHKDENGKNNNVTNLEVCNATYNMNYGTLKERIAEHFNKPVNQIKDGIIIDTFPSIKIASKKTNIIGSNIAKCCRGYKYRKTAGGFQWQYAT